MKTSKEGREKSKIDIKFKHRLWLFLEGKRRVDLGDCMNLNIFSLRFERFRFMFFVKVKGALVKIKWKLGQMHTNFLQRSLVSVIKIQISSSVR